jgi:hypothetical protein
MSNPCTTCYWRHGSDEFAKCRAPAVTIKAHPSGLVTSGYREPYCTNLREVPGSLAACGREGSWWGQRQWWRR